MALTLSPFRNGPGAPPISPFPAPPSHWSDQAVRTVHAVLDGASDPILFGSMLGAQITFGLSRLTFARFLPKALSWGKTLLAANGAAFGLEGLAFVGSDHGLRHALGRTIAPDSNLFKELGHTYLTLGLLKGLSGLVSSGLQLGYRGIPPVNLGWKDRLILTGAPQAAAFSGIYLSHTLAPSLGLADPMGQGERLEQSAFTLLNFAMVGSVLGRIPGYTQAHHEIQRRTQMELQRRWEDLSRIAGSGESPLQEVLLGPKSLPDVKKEDLRTQNIFKMEEKSESVGNSEPPRYLFITGGSSGIGEHLVLQAAARGYIVLFGGSRPFGDLSPHLQKLGISNYLQMDVCSPEAIATFRDIAMSRHRTDPGPMLVMASAGISAREGEAAIQRMREINVEGTRRLLDAFHQEISQQDGSRFVGVGSVVAAENAAVRGDEAYQKTKREIHELILGLGRSEGAPLAKGFTLIPGAVDTPMTRKEMIFGLLFLQAISEGKRPGSALRPHLAKLVSNQELLKTSPAEIFRQVLGGALIFSPNFPKLEKLLNKDPSLVTRLQLVIADQLVKDPDLQEAVVRVLGKMDLVIPPDLVAERTLDQFESGEIPAQRMLKVYSRHGTDPIVSLMGRMGSENSRN